MWVESIASIRRTGERSSAAGGIWGIQDGACRRVGDQPSDFIQIRCRGREVKAGTQRVMHCPCGQPKVLARGLCATCYTLKRQDEAYFGGHREEVLKRDGYRCRVVGCTTLKRGKRSVAVHHREPGNNDPATMITLCLSCPCEGLAHFLRPGQLAGVPSCALERAAPGGSRAGRIELCVGDAAGEGCSVVC